VATSLNRCGLATLLFDLLTDSEASDRSKVFDISLLARRLVAACTTVMGRADTKTLRLGLFGASTGAAAALVAAATLGDRVAAVVSRGGRPDLAAEHLIEVHAPTLLVVGGADHTVLELNREAAACMRGLVEVAVVVGAGHLFEEPGALEEVSRLACGWFENHLRAV
jgi:pimeloyl-ACP methyl ester carboxylesterase